MDNNQCLAEHPHRMDTDTPRLPHSDAELVALLRRESVCRKLAFNALLERQRDWLLNLCTFRLGDRQDAQDVVQLVMLRAWQAFDRFEGRSAFRTWLYSIAENQCRTFAVRRVRHLQTEHLERLIDLHLQYGCADGIDTFVRTQAVAAALARLGDKAREVLLLRFFQDCSLEDIAGTLAISLSAAKMRLYRSLEQFRTEYLRITGPYAGAA